MADNRLALIFCGNDAASTYSNGDVIEILYDDDTDVISVELNGSVVTSGGAMFFNEYSADLGVLGYYNTRFDQTLIDTSKSTYKYCTGNDLTEFQLTEAFPYFVKVLTVESPTCTLAACDLIIVGSPVLTSPTTATGVDGTIQVSGVSSLGAVRFSLIPFAYANGGLEAQTVNGNTYTYTFSGLGVGEHRIYLKDAQGCTEETTVNLAFSDVGASYGLKYFYSYTGRYGDVDLIRIYEKEYSGSSEELAVDRDSDETLPAEPLVYSRGKTGTQFSTRIDDSSVVIGIRQKTADKFEALYSQAEKKFLLEWYRNPADLASPVASEMYFKGFNTPSLGDESYQALPYVSYFTFTDKLSDLDGFDFNNEYEDPNDDNKLITTSLKGSLSVIEILAFCLNKLGLDKGIRVGVNIFASTFDQALTDDPFLQTFVNVNTYYPGGAALTCKEVIERILTPFQATLFSWGGYYYILRLPESVTTWKYRQFNKNGVYESNSSVTSPYVDVKNASEANRVIYMAEGNTKSNADEYKSINLTILRDIADSIYSKFNSQTYNENTGKFQGWEEINNGDTGGWEVRIIGETFAASQSTSESAIIARSGSLINYAYVSSTNATQGANAFIRSIKPVEYNRFDTFTLKVEYSIKGGVSSQLTLPFIRLKFMIKVGSKYLSSAGTWEATEQILIHRITNFNGSTEFEINANFDSTVNTAVTQDMEVRLYKVDPYENDVNAPIFFSFAPEDDALNNKIKALSTTGLKVGAEIIATLTDAQVSNYVMYYFRLENYRADNDYQFGLIPTDDSTLIWSYYRQENPELGLAQATVISYLDVELTTQPGGLELAEQKTSKFYINKDNTIDLDLEFYHFDTDQAQNNTEGMVKNGFYDAAGLPTQNWTTLGGTVQSSIQDLHYKTLTKFLNVQDANGRRAARKMSVNYKSNIDIQAFQSVRDTNDDNRVYYCNQITWNVKAMTFQSNELMETGSDTITINKAHEDASHDAGHN